MSARDPWETEPAGTLDPWETEHPAPAAEKPKTSSIKRDIKNVALGALHGASNIGATILQPLDYMGLTGRTNDERRAALDEFYKENADHESLAFAGGDLASSIAGTAGVGGAVAAPLKAAKVLPKVAAALESGGLSLGKGAAPAKHVLGKAINAATRVGAGAATGAAAAGLMNPDDVTSGAVIGAAIPVAAKALPLAGKAASHALGLTTGVGGESIVQAAKAGAAGGEPGRLFKKALRGESDPFDVLDKARKNVADMGAQKAAAYRSGMADISNDKSILDFAGIDKALAGAFDVSHYKGEVKNAKAADALSRIAGVINDWKALDPAQYHTPEGLDALKQRIGGIVESIPFEEKTARKVGRDMYQSVRSEIAKQAPTYDKVMKDYSSASDVIAEIEKALSLGNRASADTAMRKLQSLMRNNVQTNYGARTKLADQMIEAGGRDIYPELAGHTLNAWEPRGIGRGAAGIEALAAIVHPEIIPALLASSPRITGEAAYKAGQTARMLRGKPVTPIATTAIMRSIQGE
jgi:hypothetical protein